MLLVPRVGRTLAICIMNFQRFYRLLVYQGLMKNLCAKIMYFNAVIYNSTTLINCELSNGEMVK